ncbi:hypothetical protein WJX77_008595 [Trebouxia sp. C0004]
MPLACRQSFLSTKGSNIAVVSCESSSFRQSRHPRCQAQDTDLTDATTLVSRRLACFAPLIGFGAFTLRPPSSSAAGIPNVLSQTLKKQLEPYLSAPAEFLRTRQRANGGEIILAPIRSSRQILEAAEASLRELNIYEPDPAIYNSVLSKVRIASLDCYIREGQVASTKEALQVANAEDFLQAAENDSLETKATQITQKWIKIADPCTFRLIAKNVTSLLPREQRELKVKTYKQLEELIQSFQLLDDIVDMAQQGDGTARERVPGCLQFTLAQITSFENCILTSLGFEPVLAT